MWLCDIVIIKIKKNLLGILGKKWFIIIILNIIIISSSSSNSSLGGGDTVEHTRKLSQDHNPTTQATSTLVNHIHCDAHVVGDNAAAQGLHPAMAAL